MDKIEAEQEKIKLTQQIDNHIQSDKMLKMSSEVRRMSEILDEFQEAHLVIKRPEDGEILG